MRNALNRIEERFGVRQAGFALLVWILVILAVLNLQIAATILGSGVILLYLVSPNKWWTVRHDTPLAPQERRSSQVSDAETQVLPRHRTD